MGQRKIKPSDAKGRLDARYRYWKKIGYDIEYSRNADGSLLVKFTNHSENLPCYVEYKKDRIVCYGDYSSYVFNYSSGCDPHNVNYGSYDYFIGKADDSIETKEFDDESAIDTLKKWKRDYVETYYANSFKGSDEYQEFKEAFDDMIDGLDDSNCWPRLDCFFNKIGYDDWGEEFNGIGMVYTEHALAQLVILRIIDEDYNAETDKR